MSSPIRHLILLLFLAASAGVAVGKLPPAPKGNENHWSFKAPVRPEVPVPKNTAWPRNAIDAFVAAEHERLGLTPRPEAPKHVLLRRVYLDLIGLPPTRQQLQAFLNDTRPDAYERVVDGLLASPAYGERWGRHWMDVWRYSDWAGYAAEVRESQPHVWRWRDWIVESLNGDRPYDQMVREMLAGDEIDPADPNTLRATGYLARNWYKFNRNVWLENTVEHTAKAFLGVTMNCARCHDHMYDPVTQKEHYQFRAFFEPYDVRTDRVPGEPDTAKAGLVRVYDKELTAPTFLFLRGDEKSPVNDEPLAPATPAVLGGPPEVKPVELPVTGYFQGAEAWLREEAIKSAESALRQADASVAEADKAVVEAQKKLDGATVATLTDARSALEKAQATATLSRLRAVAARADLTATTARLAADAAKFAPSPPPDSAGLAASAAKIERDAAVFRAEADVLSAEQAVASSKKDDTEKKLADARKKLEEAREKAKQPDNDYTPLTKVYPKTSTGRRLALANWITSRQNPLAARVAVNHMWGRHFGEGIVPTVFDFGLNGMAPTNQPLLDWLAVEFMESGWKMKHLHRLIVTAATYRMDSRDDETGETNRQKDPDNRYLWRAPVRRMEAELVRDGLLHLAGKLDATTGGPELDHVAGLTTFRRSLYYRHAHEKQMTFLKLFDAANPNECYRRHGSVVPQQALALANSPLAIAQSRLLAARLKDEPDFLAAAFESVLCRPPTEQERALCDEFLASQSKALAEKSSLTAFTAGDAPPVPPSEDPKQRARENLVHVLVNHNDFVTIR